MAQRLAVEIARKQFEETAKIFLVEFLGRRELPEQGAEPVAQFGYAGVQKAFDGVAGLLSTRRLTA